MRAYVLWDKKSRLYYGEWGGPADKLIDAHFYRVKSEAENQREDGEEIRAVEIKLVPRKRGKR